MQVMIPTGTSTSCKSIRGKDDRPSLVENYRMALQSIKPPGIPAIKQWELYSKWRPFVPDPQQETLCPRPSDEVVFAMKKRNQEKSQKALAKKQAAKKARNNYDSTLPTETMHPGITIRESTIQTPERENDERGV